MNLLRFQISARGGKTACTAGGAMESHGIAAAGLRTRWHLASALAGCTRRGEMHRAATPSGGVAGNFVAGLECRHIAPSHRATPSGIHHRTEEHAMIKLRLSLDELAVESFQTGEDPMPRQGTVDAHEATPKPICAIPTLKTDLTCCPCTPML